MEVPLGKRFATGYVVSEIDHSEKNKLPFQVKSIQRVRSGMPFFVPAQLKFFSWTADYYSTELSTVIDVALPPSVPQKFRKLVSFVKMPEVLPKGKVERAILSLLEKSNGSLDYTEIQKQHKGAAPVIRRLLEKGCIKVTSHEILQRPIGGVTPAWAKLDVTLNPAQAQATSEISKAITNKQFQPFLLHGVTGSGKTEVYIEVIRCALEKGLGAIVVVPEISLTPQLIDRFRARLGDDIGVLHSALHKRTRWDSWRALLEKRTLVAIGARSGIFAPISPIGVIIVDEEHDGSYKQAEGLRYNARDLAVVRGQLENCPVVLGSATPSLETYHNALSGKYRLLGLPLRPQSMAHTDIKLVDLNSVKPWLMPSRNISPMLRDAIKDTIERKEQSFILYNRRGFASYLQCDKCNAVLKCPNCSVPLTYHQHNNAMLCHYCGLNMAPMEFCPECCESKNKAKSDGSDTNQEIGKLVKRGAGTEKVFDEIKELFPEAKVDRLDRDAVEDLDNYRKILNRMRSGETDILVGTQMIAKGHDIPNVTLMGIIDCDVGLHLPDFRAGERIFQLLTQAAGRAGRGSKPGSVILQTRAPKHPSLIFTLCGDYQSFAQQELATRKQLNYPPFSRILRIVASSEDENLPPKILDECKDTIRQIAIERKLELTILGPSPAPIQKLKTLWRAHLLVKSKSISTLHAIARALNDSRSQSKRHRLILDIDPQDML